MGYTPVPSLVDLAVQVTTTHIECVETLLGLPDILRVKLAAEVCRQNKLTP